MTVQQKNRLRAFFLITVFSLNTIIGFACSFGVNLKFNSTHHQHWKSEAFVDIQADGNKHNHDKSHHNENKTNHDPKDDKKNCCKDEALKFQKLDKSVPQSVTIIHPAFLITFFDVFYDAGLADPGIVKNIKQFVRSYHPPISNIRIAIQSFQI